MIHGVFEVQGKKIGIFQRAYIDKEGRYNDEGTEVEEIELIDGEMKKSPDFEGNWGTLADTMGLIFGLVMKLITSND